MKNNKKTTIRKQVASQSDRLSKRYGESPSHDDPKLQIDPLYKDAIDFCIQLFRQGKHLSDAVYLTRLYFTDPQTPNYIPTERWNAQNFRIMLIRWLKAD